MKKTIYILLFLVSFFGYSQEAKLKSQFGIDAILAGAGVFYEQPITKYVLADVSAGYGATPIKEYNRFALDFVSNFKPYTRIGIKAYYNRNSRAKKGKNLLKNVGSFIGIQNKTMYGTRHSNLTYMINEVYWGLQTNLENLLLNFQVGVGYYSTDYKDGSGFLPTIGIRLKYVLF